MTSKRLACLIALTEHLATEVSVANGYHHNLDGKVFRGRLKFDDDDPLPCVSLVESPNPDRFPRRAGEQDKIGDAQQKDLWTLLFQGWAVDDKANPTDPVYELMADVKMALAKLEQGPHPVTEQGGHPNFRLGGLIVSLAFEPGTVRPADENSKRAFFWMRVILTFTENVNDPFDHS